MAVAETGFLDTTDKCVAFFYQRLGGVYHYDKRINEERNAQLFLWKVDEEQQREELGHAEYSIRGRQT